MQGDRSTVDELLPQADRQFQTSHNRTLLHAAAIGGNLEIIQELLKSNIDMNAKDTLGDTALQLATQKNSIEIVRLLLAQNADPSVQNQAQETPLMTALENGYVALAQLLIAHGADVNVLNRNNRTPLSLAASLSHLGLIQQLLEQGASVKSTPPGMGVLSFVLDNSQTSTQQKQKAIALLMAKGAKIQGSELLDAIQWGQLEMVDFLIEQGADVNYEMGGRMPLIAIATAQDATEKQRLRIINRLLAAGAKINATNDSGNTALSEVVLQYHPSKQPVVYYLLQQGADVNLADRNQTTPLMLAAQIPFPEVSTTNRIELIKLLLKQGADTQAQNKQGKRAIDLTNNPQVQQLLQ
jgi:ankyrin repeat protein